MKNRRMWIGALSLALSSLLLGQRAEAFSVSQDGLEITVNYSIDAGDPTLVHFTFIGEWTAGHLWGGETLDAFGVQFGSIGGGTLLDTSVTAAAVSGDASGIWTRYYGKISGTGCGGSGADAVCFTVNPTGEGGDGAPVLTSAAVSYTWTFDVQFVDTDSRDQGLTGDHSIKFLSVELNPSGKWTVGHQLSQAGPFFGGDDDDGDDDDDDDDLPEPGTLALLGLGLLGLALVHRRRRA